MTSQPKQPHPWLFNVGVALMITAVILMLVGALFL